MNIPFDKYCVYLNNFPFINNFGRVGMCCKNNTILESDLSKTIVNYSLQELYNSDAMKEKRQQVLNGECPSGCDVCYKHEANVDMWSFRTRNLKSMCMQNGYDDIKTFDDNIIRALDLRTGNTCNLNCIMCHPSDSSKWTKIYPDYAKQVMQHNDYENHVKFIKRNYSQLNWAEHESSWDNILSSIDNNLKKIYMAGGEPFYIKNFTDYVEKIMDIAQDPFIEINTNATRLLPENKLNKLQGKLNLRISIDGFEDTDTYQRSGGTEWKEKIEVIDQYYKYFNIEAFDITLTSLTIRSFPKLVNFLEERYPNVPYILTRPVQNRKGLRPNALPKELTQETFLFMKKLERRNWYATYKYTNINQMIDLLQTQVDEKQELLRHVNYFDKINSKKYQDIDPKLTEWLND